MKTTTYAIIAFFLCVYVTTTAQVGIGTTAPKSVLDIPASNSSSPSNTDGILIPRIDAFPSVDPGADQDGMLVFLTTATGSFKKGFHYWDDTPKAWIAYNGEWSDGNVVQTHAGFDADLIYANQASSGGVDVVVLDSGHIGMGTDAPEESLELKLAGDNDIQISSASPPNPPQLIYYTTNGTLASPDFLDDNDPIGYVTGKVWNGSSKSGDVANIQIRADGDHSSGNFPTRIEFAVTETNDTSIGENDPEMVISSTGNVGIGLNDPSAVIELKAGTSSSNSAPLKLSSGTNLTNPESGAMEFDGTNLYFTPSSSRKILLKGLTNTASLNFPSIPSRGTSELTVSVTGASLGSSCSCAPNSSIESNLQWSCYVSSSNTVTVRLTNVTTGAINPASKSWKVTVIE